MKKQVFIEFYQWSLLLSLPLYHAHNLKHKTVDKKKKELPPRKALPALSLANSTQYSEIYLKNKLKTGSCLLLVK